MTRGAAFVAAVLAWPVASALALVAGGGPAANDCAAVWDGVTATRGPVGVECRDGDPACDTDAVAGQCTIEIQPCAAVPDARLAACVPAVPDAVEVRAGAEAGVASALQASLASVAAAFGAAAGTCGPAVPVTLPLDGRARARRAIRTTVRTAIGADHDVIRLLCEAAG